MMLLSRSVGWSSRRRGRNRRRIPQVALIATVALSVAGCAVDLGTLGGTSSFALDINDRGVTVGRSDTADGSTHAFRKPPGRPMRDLNGSFGQSSLAVTTGGCRLAGLGPDPRPTSCGGTAGSPTTSGR